ncbi:tautomerase family protein [Maricurvus nonylphenolicus]|uniref:tautomerase family protein n=1 Tax=Maricurvus nonylphenolicus TaxID=1008307 RepID=UPI0036F22AFD
MPLYLCSYPTGAISPEKKQTISQAVTDVHCEVTGAPPTFVHVVFFSSEKLALLQSLWGGESTADYQLFGNIRSGRTDEVKNKLVSGMRQAVADVIGVNFSEVTMSTRDVQAKWVMEGGDLLPEPGEEAAWIERHNQKMRESVQA